MMRRKTQDKGEKSQTAYFGNETYYQVMRNLFTANFGKNNSG
jgi:hypothetical protein